MITDKQQHKEQQQQQQQQQQQTGTHISTAATTPMNMRDMS